MEMSPRFAPFTELAWKVPTLFPRLFPRNEKTLELPIVTAFDSVTLPVTPSIAVMVVFVSMPFPMTSMPTARLAVDCRPVIVVAAVVVTPAS